MTPPAVERPVAVTEAEWDRMLRRVADRKVIPVIGEHLTLMSPGAPPEASLAAHLAAKLDLPGPPTASLNELAFRYLQRFPRGLDDLYADVFRALPTDDAVPLPRPLRQLAEVRDFELFVSTSFDPYLALALNEVRFGRRSSGSTQVLAYDGTGAVDIPESFTALDHPIVYHLFGKAQTTPIFAVTDEDVLEFVHKLQAPDRQPPNLFNALREHRILVLGTRLTGWLTRFFVRISSPDRLRDARRADYVVDPTAGADPDQTLFFEHFGEVKLLPMSPTQFVDELWRRWTAAHGGGAAGDRPCAARTALDRGEIFLSYASEDLAVARAMRERLEREAGVRVWLDKESLRGGHDWEARIADVLRGCAACVLLVSAHVKTGAHRFVRTEWREAVQLAKGRNADRPFILPLLVDDTRHDDPALDADVRRLHWRRLGDEEDLRRFVAEVRAAANGRPS